MTTRSAVALLFVVSTVAQAAGPVRAAASVVGWSPGASAPGRQPAPPEWLTRVSSWVEAVNEHRPGQLDMPARLVAFWTESDLEAVRTDFFALVAICGREFGRRVRPASVVYRDTLIDLRDLQARLGLTDEEAAKGNANRVLLRAAVLHADIARDVIPQLSGSIGCSSRSTMLVKDGESFGRGCLGIHWIHGRRLLDAVRPNPGRNEGVRLWHLATVVYLLELGDYANADAHIPHSQLLFPDDPAILFEHGYYHEGFASPFIQTAARESGQDSRGAKEHLEEAADLYRKALKLKPGFAEARLHRGFVLTELGRDDEAAEELARAVRDLQDTQNPQLRYYAELFLGHAEHALGRADSAREHYARASGLYPQAKSPFLALALLARQRGDRIGAQEAMRQLRDLPAWQPAASDPWWRYFRWQELESQALFRELYAYVLREFPQ
jgi:tetratricopeptide (TPR) repeat protein